VRLQFFLQFKRSILFLAASLALNASGIAYASVLPYMPAPSQLISTTANYNFARLVGMRFDSDNPFRFTFILNPGNAQVNDASLRQEIAKVDKYFLAALTLPKEELWVNLSPYENNRIATDALAQTDLGKDLLGEDYVLKQLAASLTYPESESGKKYWNEIQGRGGSRTAPTNAFSKIWVVPGKIKILEAKDRAVIAESSLKVLTDTDYLAMQKNGAGPMKESPAINAFKRHILPLIEKEVNEGRHFAHLRQMYSALIMAAWFKEKLKNTLLSDYYFGKKKLSGTQADDPQIREKIYQEYVKAFKQGVYNYVKKETVTPCGGNSTTGSSAALRALTYPSLIKITHRQYFSGGNDFRRGLPPEAGVLTSNDRTIAQVVRDVGGTVEADRAVALETPLPASLLSSAMQAAIETVRSTQALSLDQAIQKAITAIKLLNIRTSGKTDGENEILLPAIYSLRKYLPGESQGFTRIQRQGEASKIVFAALNAWRDNNGNIDLEVLIKKLVNEAQTYLGKSAKITQKGPVYIELAESVKRAQWAVDAYNKAHQGGLPINLTLALVDRVWLGHLHKINEGKLIGEPDSEHNFSLEKSTYPEIVKLEKLEVIMYGAVLTPEQRAAKASRPEAVCDRELAMEFLKKGAAGRSLPGSDLSAQQVATQDFVEMASKIVLHPDQNSSRAIAELLLQGITFEVSQQRLLAQGLPAARTRNILSLKIAAISLIGTKHLDIAFLKTQLYNGVVDRIIFLKRNEVTPTPRGGIQIEVGTAKKQISELLGDIAQTGDFTKLEFLLDALGQSGWIGTNQRSVGDVIKELKEEYLWLAWVAAQPDPMGVMRQYADAILREAGVEDLSDHDVEAVRQEMCRDRLAITHRDLDDNDELMPAFVRLVKKIQAARARRTTLRLLSITLPLGPHGMQGFKDLITRIVQENYLVDCERIMVIEQAKNTLRSYGDDKDKVVTFRHGDALWRSHLWGKGNRGHDDGNGWFLDGTYSYKDLAVKRVILLLDIDPANKSGNDVLREAGLDIMGKTDHDIYREACGLQVENPLFNQSEITFLMKRGVVGNPADGDNGQPGPNGGFDFTTDNKQDVASRDGGLIFSSTKTKAELSAMTGMHLDTLALRY